MEIKTSELSGKALDYAVGISVFEVSVGEDRWRFLDENGDHVGSVWVSQKRTFTTAWEPSVNWIQCGPLIEDLDVWLCGPIPNGKQTQSASVGLDGPSMEGSTKLLAACRAIVAYKLGGTVTVPNELEG